MQLIPLHLPKMDIGTDVPSAVIDSLRRFRSLEGSIIAISSKIVSLDQGRIVPLDNRVTSPRTRAYAKRYALPVGFVDLILRNAKRVYGGVRGALLTETSAGLIANAGIDRSNVPPGSVALWPREPWEWASRLRGTLLRTRSVRALGVLIIDSHCTPRRLGTSGTAVAIAGFRGITDLRGHRDLYGRPLKITCVNVAGDLASAAHLLQGEADDAKPVTLIRNAPVTFSGAPAKHLTDELAIAPTRDLFRDFHA